MKKIIILLAAAFAAMAFAGCGNGQATSAEAVAALADPWVEMDSLEEVEEAAGFTVEIPLGIEIDEYTVYRFCSALDEIEVQFDEPGGYLRKAKDDGDISGDYEKYAVMVEEDTNGVNVVYKGEENGSYNLATWLNGDYSYCIGLYEGIPLDDFKELVSGLK